MNAIERDLTDIIYTEMFGKSLAELVADAKNIFGDDYNPLGWSDENEAIRDHMTIEALGNLSDCEARLARRFES